MQGRFLLDRSSTRFRIILTSSDFASKSKSGFALMKWRAFVLDVEVVQLCVQLARAMLNLLRQRPCQDFC